MAFFPKPESADERGLVMVGGDLRLERLLEAYSNGIFPWYNDGQPVLWWSPDPRAIFEMDALHVSRRLARTMRSNRFEVTINRAFTDVMRGCGERREGTWVTHDMLHAYTRLHKLGFAHSVETWRDGELVGGIYGVAIGAFFSGESMFHRVSDASKVALASLFDHLRKRDYELFDTQMVTAHTKRSGASLIPRAEYLQRLRSAIRKRVRFL